jgi:hypothetical protein
LRMLRAKSGKTPSSKAAKPKETLARHWKRENELARTAFLDDIGIDQFRLAMSLTFYRRLRDLVRVEKSKAIPAARARPYSRKPYRISGPPMPSTHPRQRQPPTSPRLPRVFARLSKPLETNRITRTNQRERSSKKRDLSETHHHDDKNNLA